MKLNVSIFLLPQNFLRGETLMSVLEDSPYTTKDFKNCWEPLQSMEIFFYKR